jgi:hypothetical protein
MKVAQLYPIEDECVLAFESSERKVTVKSILKSASHPSVFDLSNTDLSEAQRHQLKQVLDKVPTVFSSDKKIGRTDKTTHRIVLTDSPPKKDTPA